MVRAALTQIFYKPAIIERNVDSLAEPGLMKQGVSTFSLLEKLTGERITELQTIHNNIREQYVAYIGQKIKKICKEADRINKPDILVFPEYSVPYQCLPIIREISTQTKMTIVAGTHTVLKAAREYYVQSGLDPEIATQHEGGSIAPVFFPNGDSDYQVKNDRSIFEITMLESESNFKRFITQTRDGETYSFSVVICVDALTMGTIAKADSSPTNPTADNFLIITVAHSTNTDVFSAPATYFALHGIPMLVCNASQYGGSGLYLPKDVRQRFINTPGQLSYLEPGKEALMLINLNPNHFFVKRSVLDNTVLGSWSICYIYHEQQIKWKKDYFDTLQEIKKSISKKDFDEAAEYAEIFLSLHEGQLPVSLENAFRTFSAHAINLCGDTQTDLLFLESALLNIHSTEIHLHSEFPKMIDFCVSVGKATTSQLISLIDERDSYPEGIVSQIIPTLPASVTKSQPTEAENLEFRDRGNYMNQIQEAITDPAVRLILVSGAYGIGKTSTIAMAFKRNLPNWSTKNISLTPTTRFSMVLEYIANAIGHPHKADTLARSGKKVLKPIIERFTKDALSKDGRAIIVDQMESILLEQQGKDHTLLTLFRDAVYNLKTGQGKLIFLSDIRFSKDIFPDNPAIKRIVVGRIPDNRYIKLLLEYEMRKHGMISPGKAPSIPDKLYELVNGHPLTAKLCVEVMARQGQKSIDSVSLGQVQTQVIEQLMQKIGLGNIEMQLMHLLSVFRTLIEVSRLKRYLSPEECTLLDENTDWLNMTSFISAGDDTLEITSIFRKYYYEQIPPEQKEVYHKYALNYYVDLHNELSKNHQFSALIYAEIAYHLTCLGQTNQLKNYLPGNIVTLKQLAKTLYQRDKNYSTALQIYRMLNEAYPGDVEVLSYLGRCYARKNEWDCTKEYFEEAIRIAASKNEETWYLYRDWGHLNLRYYMEEEATEHFAQARSLLIQECGQSDDPGILAAEGFMLERNLDISGAIAKYKAALELNSRHEFTIHNYASLLRKCGEDKEAYELEKQIVNDDFEGLGELTDSFFSGFDIIPDIDGDANDE